MDFLKEHKILTLAVISAILIAPIYIVYNIVSDIFIRQERISCVDRATTGFLNRAKPSEEIELDIKVCETKYPIKY